MIISTKTNNPDTNLFPYYILIVFAAVWRSLLGLMK